MILAHRLGPLSSKKGYCSTPPELEPMTVASLWRATRAYSFPASVIPVLLGTALAVRGYAQDVPVSFHAFSFALTLLGALLAHFGANVLNDYFDFINGVDTRPEHGSGVLTGGLMTARQTLIFGAALMVGAALCGLLLLPGHSSVILPLALLGLGCAVLYPAFLKRYALGDFLIVLAFGLGLTLGAYGIQTGVLSSKQWLLISLYAVPISLLVDAILHANNLRDASDDRAAHVRTPGDFAAAERRPSPTGLPALWPNRLCPRRCFDPVFTPLELTDFVVAAASRARLSQRQCVGDGAGTSAFWTALYSLAPLQARFCLRIISMPAARPTPRI